MWRDAWLVARKDLTIEARSRVAVGQVLPFALVVLILFGFALDPSGLASATAGLFWVAVLLSAVLAVQRSFAIESVDSARDGLRLSGLDPLGIFFGKAGAVLLQLLALELLLGIGAVLLYSTHVHGVAVLVAACVAASVGLASVGAVYGAMAGGSRVRETLLPLLFLPVVAPVLLGATEVWQAALSGHPGRAGGWMALLASFAVVYAAAGTLAFGPLLEDA